MHKPGIKRHLSTSWRKNAHFVPAAQKNPRPRATTSHDSQVIDKHGKNHVIHCFWPDLLLPLPLKDKKFHCKASFPRVDFGAACPRKPCLLYFAMDLIAAKPVKPCDGGVFEALNLLSKRERHTGLNSNQSLRFHFLKAPPRGQKRRPISLPVLEWQERQTCPGLLSACSSTACAVKAGRWIRTYGLRAMTSCSS